MDNAGQFSGNSGDALVKPKKPVTGAITWMKTPSLHSWPLVCKDVDTAARFLSFHRSLRTLCGYHILQRRPIWNVYSMHMGKIRKKIYHQLWLVFDQPPFSEDSIPTPLGLLPIKAFLHNVPPDSYVFVDCVGTIRVDLLDAILSLKAFDAI